MADVKFSEHPAKAGSSWSLFSWSPTSVTKAQEAESKLLSRFQYFRPSTPSAHAASSAEAVANEQATVEVKSARKGSFPDVAASEPPPSEGDDASPHHHRLIARVGLVDVGDKEFINTLVIDRVEKPLEGFTRPGVLKREISHGSGGQMVHLEQDVAPVEEVGRTGPKKNTLVLCHGYGAGLGFFYRNYAGLSEVDGWRIYAIDWLGMANSSRPPFPKLRSGGTDEEISGDAEAFFVESLEKWRKANSIDTMTLMGHSLGGYLSAAYALRYPQHVERLVLVSPAGVGKNAEVDMRNRKGFLPKLFTTLWTWNVTPMTLIRGMGPWGPNLVHRYTTRRFAYLDESDSNDFRDYIYHISAQPGSGEFALSRLLLPGAWARCPLHDRLATLTMPTTFIYGSGDWMDYKSAVSAAQHMKVPVRVARVADAGHHLYMDNPEAFNAALIEEMTGRTKGTPIDGVEYVLERE
ncbi:hypothetical protein HKX48_005019 [Thoreauomyces humboldtii]|nr:hypothetical protein HKX48_005019 [Thoreauomyces humboldtii]